MRCIVHHSNFKSWKWGKNIFVRQLHAQNTRPHCMLVISFTNCVNFVIPRIYHRPVAFIIYDSEKISWQQWTRPKRFKIYNELNYVHRSLSFSLSLMSWVYVERCDFFLFCFFKATMGEIERENKARVEVLCILWMFICTLYFYIVLLARAGFTFHVLTIQSGCCSFESHVQCVCVSLLRWKRFCSVNKHWPPMWSYILQLQPLTFFTV